MQQHMVQATPHFLLGADQSMQQHMMQATPHFLRVTYLSPILALPELFRFGLINGTPGYYIWDLLLPGGLCFMASWVN